MLIVADKRVPGSAKERLQQLGDVLLLETDSITYDAVSGHPDIFFCNTENGLTIAPNLPQKVKDKLNDFGIQFVEGSMPVGKKYPATARYNAVVTVKFLIHNLKYTDDHILQLTGDLIKINVRQAYTRCNLLYLDDDTFITSDKGIEKALLQHGLQVLYVSPAGIELPGFDNGFFGGACGVYGKTVYILGSLSKYDEGVNVKSFIANAGFEIVELYDGKLYDGGSVLFLD